MIKTALIRQLFTVIVACGLFFWVGWDMSQHMKQKVAELLDKDKASRLLAEWCKHDSGYRNDPEFYLLCAMIHQKNGNLEATRYNLNKALALLGK